MCLVTALSPVLCLNQIKGAEAAAAAAACVALPMTHALIISLARKKVQH